MLLYAPSYDVDIIEQRRRLHERAPFTPGYFDRWLQNFHDTTADGWSGRTVSAVFEKENADSCVITARVASSDRSQTCLQTMR